MTLKLVLLKSGEEVITDVQEMVVEGEEGEQSVVGYFFNDPYSAVLYRNDKDDVEGLNRSKYKILLNQWMPLSKDDKIPVVAEWVITLVNPVDELVDIYEKTISLKNDKSKNNVVDEQTGTSDSD